MAADNYANFLREITNRDKGFADFEGCEGLDRKTRGSGDMKINRANACGV